MQELVVVEVEDQCLAAAGGHPAGQFGQVGLCEVSCGRDVRVPRLCGRDARVPGIALTDEGIQVSQQLRFVIEEVVEDNFGVECSQVLEVAQGDRLTAALIDGGQVRADILIVTRQVFR